MNNTNVPLKSNDMQKSLNKSKSAQDLRCISSFDDSSYDSFLNMDLKQEDMTKNTSQRELQIQANADNNSQKPEKELSKGSFKDFGYGHKDEKADNNIPVETKERNGSEIEVSSNDDHSWSFNRLEHTDKGFANNENNEERNRDICYGTCITYNCSDSYSSDIFQTKENNIEENCGELLSLNVSEPYRIRENISILEQNFNQNVNNNSASNNNISSESNRSIPLYSSMGFKEDMSAIFQKPSNVAQNETSNNRNGVKQNEDINRIFEQKTQNKDASNDKVYKNIDNDDKEELAHGVSEHLARSIQENSKFNEVEEKLENISKLFADQLNNLKEEFSNTNIPESKTAQLNLSLYQPSGVQTKHFNIYCDNCQKREFIGKRYKCMECWNFDLCEICEGITSHPHPMVRIIVPDTKRNFTGLNKLYNIRCDMKNRVDDEIMDKFIRNITGNQYADGLYQHLLKTHKHLGVENFILEMTKIFG